MELVQILKTLSRSKALVAAAAVLALLAAIAVVATRGSTERGGAASAEVLVDARDSTLGDLRHDTLPLVSRSNILARYLGAGGATDSIADEARVPADELTVVGPPLNIDGVPDQAAAEEATQEATGAPYLVQVQQGDELPMLTILSKAPTVEGARALTDGTISALTDFVSEYQDQTEIPSNRRVTIRPLGETRASAFTSSPSPLLPIAVFILVFGMSCIAIAAWPNVSRALREDGPEGGEDAASNGSGPKVVPTPLVATSPERSAEEATRASNG